MMPTYEQIIYQMTDCSIIKFDSECCTVQCLVSVKTTNQAEIISLQLTEIPV